VVLDRTDGILVAALQKNARASNKALAEEAGIAPSTCLERVRALVTRGVLRGFHAEVDPGEIGRGTQAIVAVRIRPHSREVVDDFARYALSLPDTIAIYHVSGADDFLIHVAVPSTDRLRDLLLDRLTSRPEVANLETHLVFAGRRKPVIEPGEG
jgi:DNA-binding Lrp family transcriptional regulator